MFEKGQHESFEGIKCEVRVELSLPLHLYRVMEE